MNSQMRELSVSQSETMGRPGGILGCGQELGGLWILGKM